MVGIYNNLIHSIVDPSFFIKERNLYIYVATEFVLSFKNTQLGSFQLKVTKPLNKYFPSYHTTSLLLIKLIKGLLNIFFVSMVTKKVV